MFALRSIAYLLIAFLFISKSKAQVVYTSENDVINTKKIVFYGYDFSGFQLADGKRMGQEIKNYVFSLIGEYNEHLPEKKLKKWLEIDTITYSLNAVLSVNKKISNEDLVTPIKHTISKDSIQSFINRYPIMEKEGIGYVIIYECFDNSAKRVSAYSVFFDIATKKALLIDYVSKRDGNSYNRLSDWNAASFGAIKGLTDLYLDRVKANKNASKNK